MHTRRFIIIGGGLAGLTAGYDLVRAGYRVTILEAARHWGGLADSFTIEGQPVERFYHFICRSDRHLIQLVHELGLSDQLHWKQTRTAFYHNGRLYPFGTPFDLLHFSAVPWIQRVRFGMHILRSRYRMNWKWLDQIPAKPWLIENIGEEAYNVIWHPLLRIKFGEHYDKISAAWIWHRIWRVAQSRRYLWAGDTFGYLSQGSDTLVGRLVSWLEGAPTATLRRGAQAQSIQIEEGRVTGVWVDGELLPCEGVISTVALPVLDQLVHRPTTPYFARARQIDYIGVVCAVFSLRCPFSRNYWTNINDSRISFNGIIEQTNLNRNLRDAGLNVIYIPYYLPTSEPRYDYADDVLCAEYAAMLKLINPEFDPSWVKERHFFRAPYAQAICVAGFSNLVPDPRSSVGGLYVTDSAQFYPEDRTVSAAIGMGRKVAQLVLNANDAGDGSL